MKYKAKNGSRLSEKDAQLIGPELERIGKVERFITAEVVLKHASAKRSPLHDYFEWDDSKAAREYRLDQARHLLHSIVIEMENKSQIRAYHHVFVESNDQKEYVHLNRAINEEPLWKQVVLNALKEASAWATRYETYEKLHPIVSVIRAQSKDIEKEFGENLFINPHERRTKNEKEKRTG